MSVELIRDRVKAWEILTEYTKSDSLIKHALAVEAAMREYARMYNEDIEVWGNIGLLHDFDYEIHPTMDKHPMDGAPILKAKGYPDEFISVIQAHARHTGEPRDILVKKVIFAVDELCGFLIACALVRPERFEGMEPKSVRKKMKDKAFARAVSREDIIQGAEELGVELDEHIIRVTQALNKIAKELGLAQ
jgi:putative nucleotidyltransferase with HDIG domain